MRGDADIASIGALIADPGRARILLALGDGRALSASVLADEAGVAASTASAHLGKLVRGGMLRVERHGRHRYFRVSGPEVGELIEALARISPPAQVRSLKQGSKAQAVRFARTCYDHLAGMLGTQLMEAMLENELLTGGNGVFDPDAARDDRLAAPGLDLDYRLTATGVRELESFGIDFEALPPRRPLIKYCVDWSEQRHHLAGALGAALAARMIDLGWLRKADRSRAVHVSEVGYDGLREHFGLELATQ
ncbi:MAG TPA: winged helix-turn-helix domain-containing protein [Solirubrobacteraceae bacterium]|nr:winged helix-turn-helix domain-containing protein [Solirubrobacteraceae bacterium]